jgi:hypothetical protein
MQNSRPSEFCVPPPECPCLVRPIRAAAVVEVLRPIGALPLRLIGDIQSARAFVETSTGEAIVFDARAQAVYALDAARTRSRHH